MAYQQHTAFMRPQVQPQYVQYHQGQAFQQTVVPANQVFVQPQAAPATQEGGTRRNFAKDSQKGCGIAQVVLGAIAMIVGAVLIQVDGADGGSGFGFSAAGVWSGVFMILAGSFGIWSSTAQTTSTIVTCMVLSILASCFAFAYFILSAIGCGVNNNRYMWLYSDEQPARIALHSIGILVGLAEIVVSIIQSAICCRTTCCTGQQARQPLVYVPQPFPAQYALQTQGMVQGTNIPMGTSGVTVITPGTGTYPVGYTPVTQQHVQPPAQGAAGVVVPPPQGAAGVHVPPAQGAAGVVVPPAYSQTGASPPEYTEKQPVTNPEM